MGVIVSAELRSARKQKRKAQTCKLTTIPGAANAKGSRNTLQARTAQESRGPHPKTSAGARAHLACTREVRKRTGRTCPRQNQEVRSETATQAAQKHIRRRLTRRCRQPKNLGTCAAKTIFTHSVARTRDKNRTQRAAANTSANTMALARQPATHRPDGPPRHKRSKQSSTMSRAAANPCVRHGTCSSEARKPTKT